MNTKLTLRLSESLIQRAKSLARLRGKSVSQLVSDYFNALEGGEPGDAMSPKVRALRGALRGAKLDRLDYRKHLEKKYR
ncbi:MAG: DUF6364 family protein [Candidatus Eisenbacteria bacterium]|nr:DUF6364 family protein [Candidatus Eisenbacteria bacterium]